MKKLIKNAVIFAVLLALVTGLAGCGTGSSSKTGLGTSGPVYATTSAVKINFTETIRVYNASEYIDKSTIADFEREFAIKVEYEEFESNEDMYDKIAANPSAYDVLVPSDYMIDRLIKEDKLARLDKSQVPNLANIAEEYLAPAYDADNSFVVPYMAGTLGILYNRQQVAAPVESWAVLFDTQYSGKVLMLDSQRDSIGAALKMLGFSMNSSDDAELAQAKEKLQLARSIAAAFNESEEIRDKLVAGEGALGVVYSGDAKAAIDRNPHLAYVIPAEGANKWVDGFVIMKNTQHMDAAQKFINFMCRPNIAVRNMTTTGYTSPVFGAWSEFGGNKIMFAAKEELDRCEAFLFSQEAAQKYSKLWSEVR